MLPRSDKTDHLVQREPEIKYRQSQRVLLVAPVRPRRERNASEVLSIRRGAAQRQCGAAQRHCVAAVN
jgi:hypothetical protein